MTLPVQSNRQLYAGDGSTTTFAIPFNFYSTNNNVKVVLQDFSTDPYVETTQIYGTNYTIVGSNVVMTAAPSASKKLLILQKMDILQSKSLQDNQALLPSDIMNGMDRLAAMIQQVNELCARAMKFHESSVYTNLPYPDPVSDGVVKFNIAGNALEVVPASSFIGPVGPAGPQGATGATGPAGPLVTFVEAEVPTGAINNSNVTYSIAHSPVSGSFTLYKNGRRLASGEYSLSGTTLTMTTALDFGEELLCDYVY